MQVTLKTILLADTIFSVANLALYAVAWLVFRWWQKRRDASTTPEPEKKKLAHCYHCHNCCQPLLPVPHDREGAAAVLCLVGGRICRECSVDMHDGESPMP